VEEHLPSKHETPVPPKKKWSDKIAGFGNICLWAQHWGGWGRRILSSPQARAP
jgi:hypothetical protein